MAEDPLAEKREENKTPEDTGEGKVCKKSFLFYFDWFEAIQDFDDKTGMEIVRAIISEERGVSAKELSPLASLAMKFIRPQIIRDRDKYESICHRNVENGKKGGRPKNPEKPKKTQENPVGYLETQKNPEKPKKADNDIQDTNVSMSISNNKEDTTVSKKDKPLWKTSYDEYKRLFEQAKQELLNDQEFKQKMEHFYPNYDIEKTLERNLDYWLREDIYKKLCRTKGNIIPKARIVNNFDKNRILKPFHSEKTNSENSDDHIAPEVQELREKFSNFQSWLVKIRGEQKMFTYHITLDHYREMRRAYPDSAKFGELIVRLTQNPIDPNIGLIGVFREYQTKNAV